MLTKEDISRISGVDLELLDGYREIVELSGEEVDALPGGLNFLALSLLNCSSLTELPEDLPIQYLSAMGCPNLKRLPENMKLSVWFRHRGHTGKIHLLLRSCIDRMHPHQALACMLQGHNQGLYDRGLSQFGFTSRTGGGAWRL